MSSKCAERTTRDKTIVNCLLTPPHRLQHGSAIVEYEAVSGIVELRGSRARRVVPVSIVSRRMPRTLTLKKRAVTTLELMTSIHYGEPIARDKFAAAKDSIEQTAIDALHRALLEAEHHRPNDGRFRREHSAVWQSLWQTGFEISASLAEDSINGDRINATMYAVLANARTVESEVNATAAVVADQQRRMYMVEGCYDSYHTLQADNLWRDMRSVAEVNALVASWMLTLEKQGCHNLVRGGGAAGVMQAMVLSLGGFRYSNQHLELNIHPRYLHRDYLYR